MPLDQSFLLWEVSPSCLNTMDRLQIRCQWIHLSLSWCCLYQKTMNHRITLFSTVHLLVIYGQCFSMPFNGTQFLLKTRLVGSKWHGWPPIQSHKGSFFGSNITCAVLSKLWEERNARIFKNSAKASKDILDELIFNPRLCKNLQPLKITV